MSSTVSIIVPVYNTGQYVGECIESIINQNFNDWELLLIDDGSTDESAQICKGYAIRDNRIKYFYKTNGGVSSARNYGIEKASGRYIMFVDSDDICQVDLLETLYNAVSDSFDISACLVASFNGQRHDCPKIEKLYDLESIYTYLDKIGLLHPPCAKLYSGTFIRNNVIKFDESLALGEDLCFNLDYLHHVESAAIVNSPLYYYRDTPGSLTKKIRADYADIQMYLIDRKLQFISQHGLKFSYQKQAPGMVRDMFLSLCRSNADKINKIESINRIKNHRLMQLCKKTSSLSDCILLYSIEYLPASFLIKLFR